MIALFAVPLINIVAPENAAVKDALTAELVLKAVSISFLPAIVAAVAVPTIFTFLVPVGTEMTVSSASLTTVTSLFEPCHLKKDLDDLEHTNHLYHLNLL